jgi:citrate lyase subunit beta/citryl-CoA lyase
MTTPALPSWRSLLYVPANAQRFVDKAHTRGADAIILDLEDGVPPAEKTAARDALARAIPQVGQAGADVLVRINQPLQLAVADVEAAVQPGVAALVITKVEGASHVRLLDELVTRLEAERGLPVGGLRFVLVIETPQAWLEMARIFGASARNVAALLGSEDFSLACDAAPIDEVLLYPKQQMIIQARAAGLLPLGMIASVADFSDAERLLAMARRSRGFGFAGATAVHPNQVAAANQAFAPSADELARARRIVAAFEDAERAGRGAVSVDGQMVDLPVVLRARRLIGRAAPAEAPGR